MRSSQDINALRDVQGSLKGHCEKVTKSGLMREEYNTKYDIISYDVK